MCSVDNQPAGNEGGRWYACFVFRYGDSSVRWATEHIYARPRLGGSVTRPHTTIAVWVGEKPCGRAEFS